MSCGFLHLGFNFDGNAEDCMERISVETVLATCRSLLATSGYGASSSRSAQDFMAGAAR